MLDHARDGGAELHAKGGRKGVHQARNAFRIRSDFQVAAEIFEEMMETLIVFPQPNAGELDQARQNLLTNVTRCMSSEKVRRIHVGGCEHFSPHPGMKRGPDTKRGGRILLDADFKLVRGQSRRMAGEDQTRKLETGAPNFAVREVLERESDP